MALWPGSCAIAVVCATIQLTMAPAPVVSLVMHNPHTPSASGKMITCMDAPTPGIYTNHRADLQHPADPHHHDRPLLASLLHRPPLAPVLFCSVMYPCRSGTAPRDDPSDPESIQHLYLLSHTQTALRPYGAELLTMYYVGCFRTAATDDY
jgi:hypothetical protein